MDSKRYIDNLFKDYEVTESLIDFKEELQTNLRDKIESMKERGLNSNEAFNRAIEELGDVYTIAEEMNLKKKPEAFPGMYTKTKSYIKPFRLALYILCGLIITSAIINFIIFWSSAIALSRIEDIIAASAFIFLWCELGILGLIFLLLTEETTKRKAMRFKRALVYVVASGILISGVISFVMTYATNGLVFTNALTMSIPFILISVSIFIFLILTESDRRKPWAIDEKKKIDI